LARFYARRLLRLAPALIVVCLFCVGLALIVLHGHQRSFLLLEVGTSASYTSDFYFAHGRVTHDWGYLGQTWSLAVEEQFYLLWPLVLIAISRLASTLRGRVGAVLGLIVIVIVWRAHLAHEGLAAHIGVGFDAQADSLLIGCALALLLPHWREALARHQQLLDVMALLALATLLVFTLSWAPMYYIPYRLGYVVASAASAVLIARLVLPAELSVGRLMRRVFSLPIATFTGRISYSLYLWHPVLAGIVTRDLHITSGPRLLIAGPLLAIAIFAVSYASYRWVEQPFQRLKDRRLPGPAPLPPARGARDVVAVPG
jgi:peptidoglycan/LPS O-acetylase OafA/YrhL